MSDNGDSPITERVVSVVQDAFMKLSIGRSVRPNDDLRDLGLSSLALAELAFSLFYSVGRGAVPLPRHVTFANSSKL
jgi:hypothetical protein